MREKSVKAMPSFKREFSAGGVVYRKFKMQNEKLKIAWLIGKHSGYHKWVLPKGLIEEGEHGWETALREVEEEMGVKARLVSEKPIHRAQYVYFADFKKPEEGFDYQQSDESETTRRVVKYQEAGGQKTKVFKVVSFYLMEYESGDPANHGWEMEEAEWLPFEDTIGRLAFEGEREALRLAQDMAFRWDEDVMRDKIDG